jgi:hypothetical protein
MVQKKRDLGGVPPGDVPPVADLPAADLPECDPTEDQLDDPNADQLGDPNVGRRSQDQSPIHSQYQDKAIRCRISEDWELES